MVKIRLMRVGKKKQPSYRVVVADSRSPRDGRIIEAIGHYQPRAEPTGVTIDGERALYWLQQGAQPSEQVKRLLRLTGAWSEFTGEPMPKAPAAKPATTAEKATPAASVKATPAASVDEETAAEEADETTPPPDPTPPPEPAPEPDAAATDENP